MNLLKVMRILAFITYLSSLSIGQASAGVVVTTFDVEITSTINDLGAFALGDRYTFQFIHDDLIFPQINRWDDGADGIANTEDDFFSEIFLPAGYHSIDGADEFDLSMNPFQELLDDWAATLSQNNVVAKDYFNQNTRYVINGEGINGSAAGYTSDSINITLGAYDGLKGATFNAFYTDTNMEEVMAQVDFKLTRISVVPEPASLAIFTLGLMVFLSRRVHKRT